MIEVIIGGRDASAPLASSTGVYRVKYHLAKATEGAVKESLPPYLANRPADLWYISMGRSTGQTKASSGSVSV